MKLVIHLMWIIIQNPRSLQGLPLRRRHPFPERVIHNLLLKKQNRYEILSMIFYLTIVIFIKNFMINFAVKL